MAEEETTPPAVRNSSVVTVVAKSYRIKDAARNSTTARVVGHLRRYLRRSNTYAWLTTEPTGSQIVMTYPKRLRAVGRRLETAWSASTVRGWVQRGSSPRTVGRVVLVLLGVRLCVQLLAGGVTLATAFHVVALLVVGAGLKASNDAEIVR